MASERADGRFVKQEQEPASEEVTEVAPGVLRLQLPILMPGLGHVNTYALIDDRGAALVDPGLPGPRTWKALKQRLRAAGIPLKRVHSVIVTHSHPDHFGTAGRIARATGARVVTHAAFTTWIPSASTNGGSLSVERAAQLEDDLARYSAMVDLDVDALDDPLRADQDDLERTARSFPWAGAPAWGGRDQPRANAMRRAAVKAMRLLFTPPKPTTRLYHGEPIEFSGRPWFALHTPGHTLDHLCLWDPEHGTVITGDHVLPSITPHISGVPAEPGRHGGRPADALASYLATLDLVGSLPDVRRALPAHGHPFDDVPGRVHAIREHHFERIAELQDVGSERGPSTVRALTEATFPPRHWGFMAESETFAHLEHLRLTGRAERHRDGDGLLVYDVAPRATDA